MDKHPPSREDIAERLRLHGINLTHQRIEIACILFSRMEHLSANQILELVNLGHAATSKATVYNTLRLLVEKKLVREVIVDPGKTFFDPNTAAHYHFYDTVHGRLTDIPANQIEVVGLPELPPGVVADAVDIVVRTRPSD